MAKLAGGRSALGRYLDAGVLTRLMHLRLKPRGRVHGDLVGDHKSPLLGFAVEFGGHRGYVPGDDIRHIDWRAYYKVGKYYIKQYEAETNLIAHVLLDCSESMAYGEGDTRKWDYAARLATTVSHLVVAKRDKVSLGLFDDKVVDFLPASQSMLQVREIDKRLSGHEPTEKTDMGRVLMDFATRCGRRRVIIIISDCFDKVENIMRGVERMRYDMHDVVVFHVLHKDEMSFPFDGNVLFEGLEELGNVKTDAQQVRQAYQRVVETYMEDFSRKCEKIGVEYVLMDTSVPVEVALAQVLSQRMGTGRGR